MSDSAKILIVDDSAAMRRAIKLVLKGLAVQIHECSDGSEALVEYAFRLPDWVLMDIRMKVTDGFTAIRQIRTIFPDARIIVVTINRGDDMREAARSAGASAFVLKDNLLELRQILIERGVKNRSEAVSTNS